MSVTEQDNEDAAPARRTAERICWRCVFAALPPLLLLLLGAWFVASALERGRLASEAEAGAAFEELDDVGAVNEELRTRLVSAEDELTAARAALAAAGEGGAEQLVNRIVELAPPERAALLSRAGVDLAPPPASAQDLSGALQGLSAGARADFYAALPGSPTFTAWFAELGSAEKRLWLERIIGDGALDAIEIDGVMTPEGRALDQQRKAQLDRLETRLASLTDDAEAAQRRLEAEMERRAQAEQALVTARTLTAALRSEESEAEVALAQKEEALTAQRSLVEQRDAALAEKNAALEASDAGLKAAQKQVADLQDRLQTESAARSEAQTALSQARSDAEAARKAAEDREAALNDDLAAAREATAETRREMDEQRDALDAARSREEQRADRAEAALKRARAGYDRERAANADLVEAERARADRSEAALKRARAGYDRERAEAAAVAEAVASNPKAADPVALLAALRALETERREAAYQAMATGLARDIGFRAWLATDAPGPTRAAFAAFASDLPVAERVPEDGDADAASRATTDNAGADASAAALDAAATEAERLRAELASAQARLATLGAEAEDGAATLAARDKEIARLQDALSAVRRDASAESRVGTAEASETAAGAEVRIRELEAALAAAPSAEALSEKEARIAALETERAALAERLKGAVSARAAAMAALARQAKPSAAAREAEAPAPESVAGQASLTLPEIGAVAAAEAPDKVASLLAERDQTIRALRATAVGALARLGSSSGAAGGAIELPEIGEVPVKSAAGAVKALLDRRDADLRALRATTEALELKLAQKPSTAPSAARSSTTEATAASFTLPEIGATTPAEAPEAVARLLEARDRKVQALGAAYAALQTRRVAAKGVARRVDTAEATPAQSSAASATLIEPTWSAAAAQEIGGVSLAALAAPIAFDSASADLTKDGRRAVHKLAKRLVQAHKRGPNAEWRLVIEGHTDQLPIHTREFASNWELSAARAAAVAFQLNRFGVPQKRLVAVGRAATEPLDKRWSRKAFARNRRIELSLLNR